MKSRKHYVDREVFLKRMAAARRAIVSVADLILHDVETNSQPVRAGVAIHHLLSGIERINVAESWVLGEASEDKEDSSEDHS